MSAYVLAGAIVLIVVLVLRRHISASALRDVLSYFFISSLAAGLEPATAKAALLRGSASQGPDRVLLAVSAAKALAAAPFIAVVWRFIDPGLPLGALFLTPLIALAGFAASDLRVFLDVRGHYVRAIGLKQGSLAGGLVVVGALTLLGVPLVWSMAASTAARVALPLFAFDLGPARSGVRSWAAALDHLTDVRWLELMGASAISAIDGSTDRILGPRYLAPTVFATYYLVFEVFGRFWILSYVITPILFARLASHQDTGALVRGGVAFILGAGVGFLSLIGVGFLLAPALLARLLGAAYGPPIFAFALAVVLVGVMQIWFAYLQGSGRTRRATILIGLDAVLSALVFFVLLQRFGLAGLFVGWLVKALLELLVLSIWGRPNARPMPAADVGAERHRPAV
jgi:O-antigen/teichoic acid export membrane protein